MHRCIGCILGTDLLPIWFPLLECHIQRISHVAQVLACEPGDEALKPLTFAYIGTWQLHLQQRYRLVVMNRAMPTSATTIQSKSISNPAPDARLMCTQQPSVPGAKRDTERCVGIVPRDEEAIEEDDPTKGFFDQDR